MTDPQSSPPEAPAAPKLKVYFLPNLMTAGNLFCGFVALTKIVEADIAAPNFASVIRASLFFILMACIFDMLDGRVARWGGCESPFGREFDSLADLVSFGAAPAFLVHRIVLKDVFIQHPEIGWFIASIYLICGALRLARFNCLATMPGGGREFMGFPIPAAAGLVASVTLLLLWLDDRGLEQGGWRYALPGIMLFLSVMMVSEVKYPSFKSLNLGVQKPFAKLVGAILFVGLLLVLREKILPLVLPLIFGSYLMYGFFRPYLSRRMRREIEEQDDDPLEPEDKHG